MSTHMAKITTLAVLCAALAVVPSGGQTANYEALARSFIGTLAAGQYDAAESQFDAAMQHALPASALQAFWGRMTAAQGAYQVISASQVQERGAFHVAVISAEFERGAIAFVIAFNSEGKIAGLHFNPSTPPWEPPDYADPKSFRETPVSVGENPYPLPGTLTIPNGAGPFPVVVLVPGSGPNDEDETIGPNKPFKDLAWGLASQGIAVLRYTKRTKQYPQIARKLGFTVMDETVKDARAAVALAARFPGLDPSRIFILGHSQGGGLAPRIADSQIAGIIIMAGNTEKLGDALVRQVRYEMSLAGTPPPPAAKKELEAVEAADQKAKSPSLKPSDEVNLLGVNIPGSYLLDLRNYNPTETAASLHIPILILQGGRDFNVTVDDDFNVWKKALAGHANVEFRLYPDLNHLFMTGSVPPNPRDDFKKGHVSKQVVNDIAGWVKQSR